MQDNPHKISTVCSSDVLGEKTEKPPEAKENPGALAGATGDFEIGEWFARIDHNLKRESSARDLARAVADCDPADRLPFVERIYEGLRGGMPIPAFAGLMAEANFWAGMAGRAEKKAYGAACFNRMARADQRAFLNYAQEALNDGRA